MKKKKKPTKELLNTLKKIKRLQESSEAAIDRHNLIIAALDCYVDMLTVDYE